jgi:hypothetical protein
MGENEMILKQLAEVPFCVNSVTLRGIVCAISPIHQLFNPLQPELNPSAQRCLPRFFTGDFNF